MTDIDIASLLQDFIGLKVTSIGQNTLNRSVQRRMRALSMSDKEAYAEKLKSSSFELKELIEEVIIPETWFYRDCEPFRATKHFLVNQWIPKHKNNLFRVLSVPCSSGEEPYSLAMTLLRSGLAEDKFTVLGVDISHRSIDKAKKGIYTEHSFRGTDLGFRSKFFKKHDSSYILDEKIRKKVHFYCGNILDNTFMEGLGLFDVIFFRNVLIYFDSLARHKAISTLYKILADDGILFVGHAEANLFNNSPFTPAPYSQAFAFRKKTKGEMIAKVEKTKKRTKKSFKRSRTPSTKKIFPFQKKSTEVLPDLKVAQKLADKGELQKATEICEAYMKQYGPSAQAFFLLGIIHDAANDVKQAEKLFRKALYLDPNHEESLVFLSLFAEKTGDTAEANNLKQRIARLHNNTISQS